MRRKLGIAITARQGGDALHQQIGRIGGMCATDPHLLVCDDGLPPEALSMLDDERVRWVGGTAREAAWNRNRGLYGLFTFTDVDAVLLMEEGVEPAIQGWELEWLEGALRYGAIGLVPSDVPVRETGGACTAEEPGLLRCVHGACLAVSREAFGAVGFMDTRVASAVSMQEDYMIRQVRAGYGGVMLAQEAWFLAISGGIVQVPDSSETTPLPAEHETPVWCPAWHTEQERDAFLSEFAELTMRRPSPIEALVRNFDSEAYLLANPDVRAASMDGVGHYLCYGRAENRPLRPA
ncbi:hypothetical protein [Acetobacter estunensis]|uniref:hypothetical protein n=1 Tax=Acetobacter estunensis TaxID=104097 RepID=UPI001C2CDEA0|nr:hypothetical protein [Acetobacter estunensis]MBV1837461.1 hypothetical protein [Acetobacter estunensis]